MAADKEAGIGTRKPDDAVGSPGAPAAGAGHHTADQAAITDMGAGGRSDADRTDTLKEGGEPGRSPPVPGGASGGHSDRKASRGPDVGGTAAGQASGTKASDR